MSVTEWAHGGAKQLLPKRTHWKAQILLPKQVPSPGVFLFWVPLACCQVLGTVDLNRLSKTILSEFGKMERNYLFKSYTGLE